MTQTRYPHFVFQYSGTAYQLHRAQHSAINSHDYRHCALGASRHGHATNSAITSLVDTVRQSSFLATPTVFDARMHNQQRAHSANLRFFFVQIQTSATN